jgi:hypothetical protein
MDHTTERAFAGASHAPGAIYQLDGYFHDERPHFLRPFRSHVDMEAAMRRHRSRPPLSPAMPIATQVSVGGKIHLRSPNPLRPVEISPVAGLELSQEEVVS